MGLQTFDMINSMMSRKMVRSSGARPDKRCGRQKEIIFLKVLKELLFLKVLKELHMNP